MTSLPLLELLPVIYSTWTHENPPPPDGYRRYHIKHLCMVLFIFAQEYTVKTPTKMQIYQRENKYLLTGRSNKKRKAVFDFEVNSDSSETTDLLVKIL